MLYNTRASNILLNTGDFRGPPIVCFSADYTTVLNATCWTNLLALATQLDVPAFHVDVVHDGGISTLLQVLKNNLQRFYSAQAVDPWVHSSGNDNTVYPPSGPIFYFDRNSSNPNTDSPGSGAYLAVQWAQSCVNYRRNHLYEHAMDSVWPVSGESLDRIQRPPIHGFKSQFVNPSWFTKVVYQQWVTGSVVGDYKAAVKAGCDVLLTQEGSYPGISRHIMPSMAQNYRPFVYPWS